MFDQAKQHWTQPHIQKEILQCMWPTNINAKRKIWFSFYIFNGFALLSMDFWSMHALFDSRWSFGVCCILRIPHQLMSPCLPKRLLSPIEASYFNKAKAVSWYTFGGCHFPFLGNKWWHTEYLNNPRWMSLCQRNWPPTKNGALLQSQSRKSLEMDGRRSPSNPGEDTRTIVSFTKCFL